MDDKKETETKPAHSPLSGHRPAGQHPAGRRPTGHHLAGPHPAGQHPTGQHSPGQHTTGQHTTVQHPIGQHPPGQHLTGQHSPGQRPAGGVSKHEPPGTSHPPGGVHKLHKPGEGLHGKPHGATPAHHLPAPPPGEKHPLGAHRPSTLHRKSVRDIEIFNPSTDIKDESKSTDHVISQQPIDAIASSAPLISNGSFKKDPRQALCPKCNTEVTTETYPVVGRKTYLAFGVLCATLMWFGCCLMPFCTEDCQDIGHRCPNCRTYIGLWQRPVCGEQTGSQSS